MDLSVCNLPLNLESVAAISMLEVNGGDSATPPAKRQRYGEGVNKVAEIVLVLSALGRMRGGETPTEFEIELMVEARSKLATMCQDLIPKDIIYEDDVRAVIDDLGLNQRLGIQSSPKVTISEKVSLSKRKMEEASKFLTSTVSQPNGCVVKSPGLGKSVPVTHQLPRGCAANTTGSQFRTERPQGTAISSADYYAGSWSAEPQSTISFTTASDKKASLQSFRPQTLHGTYQPMQGIHNGQASSSGNNHNEIAKIVHKVLQPLVKQYPLWNPPSREYMSIAMACQMCGVTTSEVEPLLICDSCEKAYHLKCLQANNAIGVLKSEWHCSRCVQASNGKPFLPQYGRTTPKKPAGTAGVQSSAAKKVGSEDVKVNEQKEIVTTSTGKALIADGGQQALMENVAKCENPSGSTSHSDTLNAKTTPENGQESSKDAMEVSVSETCKNSLTKSPTTVISHGDTKITEEPQENSEYRTASCVIKL